MNVLLYISFLITATNQFPHIFEDNKNTCELYLQSEKKTKRYVVPALINADNEEVRISISLCSKNPYVLGGQTTSSKISLYNKSSKNTQISEAQPYEVLQQNEVVFISITTDIKCENLLNYKIVINLVNSNLKKPRLNIDNDECEIEIDILNPDFHPPCKVHIDSKWFIDLTRLKGKTVSMIENGTTFNVSLCGPAAGCNRDAGCKIQGNEKTIFGSLNKQQVQFNYGTNAVSVVSSMKDGRSKKTMLMNLKCNWNVPDFSKPKLINQGTNFKFEVQSSFGCVKLPKSCIIKVENHHLTYDLRSLLNKDGTIVAKAPADIRINICGDLQIKGNKNNRCHKQKSQVCEIHGNDFVNRGSIPNFEVISGNIRASFRDGQECNVNETYSTIVDFKCSTNEKGPVYVKQEKCSTKILWETSKACPMYRINTKSCSFHSANGNIDLSGLYRIDGSAEILSQNKKLFYNICGKLNFNCSASDQVSACLIDGNRQKIIGWNEPNLSYIDGKLQLIYTGERCEAKNQPYSLTINMMCSFTENQTKKDFSKVNECDYEITLSNYWGCLKPWETKECTLEEENFRYDLTPLIAKETNYEIKDDKNGDRTYFLNLCAPVIPKEGLLSTSNSMMTMRDSAVALITEKFKTLGFVTQPFLEEDNVIVKLTGSMCTPGVFYSTKIHFECSNNEESPAILQSKGCNLEFIWRTRHACLIMKQGGRCLLSDGNSTAKVPGDPIEVKIDNLNTYHFSLCLEHYHWCKSNGSCVTKKLLSKTIKAQNDIFYIRLNMEDSDHSLVKTVSLTVECDPSIFLNFSKGQSRNPEHLQLYVKTRISCEKSSSKPNRAAEQVESHKEYKYEVEHVSANYNEKTKNKNNDEMEDDDHKAKAITDKTEPKNKSPSYVLKPLEESEENKTSHLNEEPNEPEETKDDTPSYSPEKNGEKKPSHLSEKNSEKEIKPTDNSSFIPNERCNIITVNGKTLNMKDWPSKEIKLPNALYILNFDANSSKCGGLICKNGGNILNFIEDCPDVSYGEDYIDLNYHNARSSHSSYSANSSVSFVDKRIELHLSCNYDAITAEAFEISSKIAFHYSSQEICVYLEYSKSLTMIFVISGLLIFLILCSVIGYVLYTKNSFKRCYYQPVSEDLSLVVHSKMH